MTNLSNMSASRVSGLSDGMREALGAAVYQMQGPLNVIQAAIRMLKASDPEPTTLASMLAQISAGRNGLRIQKLAVSRAPMRAMTRMFLTRSFSCA